MSEIFRIACPQCQHRLRVKTEFIGKKAACNRCGAEFVITPPTGEPQPSAGAASPESANPLGSRLPELEAENARLREGVASARADADELRSALEAKGRQLDDFEARSQERDAAGKSIEEDLGRRLEKAESESRALAEEVAALKGVVAELESARREIEAERSAWEAERAGQPADDNAAKVQWLTEMADGLAAQVETAAAERDQATADLAAQVEELRSLRELVGQAHQFREEMKTFLGGLGIKLPH